MMQSLNVRFGTALSVFQSLTQTFILQQSHGSIQGFKCSPERVWGKGSQGTTVTKNKDDQFKQKYFASI